MKKTEADCGERLFEAFEILRKALLVVQNRHPLIRVSPRSWQKCPQDRSEASREVEKRSEKASQDVHGGKERDFFFSGAALDLWNEKQHEDKQRDRVAVLQASSISSCARILCCAIVRYQGGG